MRIRTYIHDMNLHNSGLVELYAECGHPVYQGYRNILQTWDKCHQFYLPSSPITNCKSQFLTLITPHSRHANYGTLFLWFLSLYPSELTFHVAIDDPYYSYKCKNVSRNGSDRNKDVHRLYICSKTGVDGIQHGQIQDIVKGGQAR